MSEAQPLARTGLIRLGAWVIVLLSGLFLLTTGGTYPGIASVEGHVVGQLIGITVLGGWLLISVVRGEWRPRTPLLVPLALASAAYLASALVSQRPRLSLEPTIAGLGWALAFLFLTRLLSMAWFRARAAVLMTAVVAVVAIGYLIQVGGEWITWWGLIGRFAVPPLRPSFAALFLGSPNLIATALILVAPLVVAVAWLRPRQRWLGAFLAAASALATFISGSRGAYLGVGLGAFLAAALFATRRGGLGSTVESSIDRLRRQPILIVPVAVVPVLGAVFAPSVIQRFQQGGADLRFDLWRAAATIFAEHPILGGGPGTWVQLKVTANPPGVPNLILPHAHDMYVQAAAEVGIVGLLALAWLAIAVIRRLWAGWRSTERSVSLEAGAVLVSLAAFAGQSIVDNLSNLPFVLLLVVTLVAWVDGRLTETGPSAIDRWTARFAASPIPVGVGLIVLLALVPTLIRVDAAAIGSSAGDGNAIRGYWQLALDDYDAARRADPGFSLYELQTASALARVGRTAEARNMLRGAVQQDPVAMNVVGLAALDAAAGDAEAARAHLLHAAASGIGEPAVALNAGLVAERIGDVDTALDQFANAIAWDPPLASANVWTMPPRKVPFANVLAAARARTNPLDAALMLAYSGDTDVARAELENQPSSPTRDAYIATVIALGGNGSNSMAAFRSILDKNPSDWVTAALAARVAGRVEASADAARYIAWAIALQGDSAPGLISEASVVPASPNDASASMPLNYPWSTYLRPITPYVLMPGLTLIGVR
jgi:putative inorganic carbon (HCO3(-)) transporter